MSNNKESTRFIYAEISTEEFGILNRWATSLGKRNSAIIRSFVQKYLREIAADKEEGTMPLDLWLMHQHYMMSRNRDHKSLLMEMAYTYQEYPTEDNADRLALACEKCGTDKEEVLEWINDDKLVPFSSDAGSITSKAMVWLQRHMKPGEEYKCTEIEEESGFSASALRSAKTKLGIKSVRRSTSWVWVMGETEETPVLEPPAYLADQKKKNNNMGL